MDIIDVLTEVMPDLPEVTIEPYRGRSAYGDVWDTGTPVRAFVDQARRVVRADDGSQVISETTVYAPPGTTAPARSRVTLPDGSTTLVITTRIRDGFGQDALPEHVEIACE
ncbi:hypothetical protein [Actinomadura miaoliensis]|uniref:Head-to-tail stopper n=1 Tax=Actinomadura miaoliensis TaxID=430685 RepID=A0ABP7V557_9ACTN